MATKRQKQAFLWGEEQLKFLDLSYYERARNEKDLLKRTYHWNRVFHGVRGKAKSKRDTAFLLTKEIHGLNKKTEKPKNYQDMSKIVAYSTRNVGSGVLISEKKNNNPSSNLLAIRELNAHESFDIIDLPLIIREIVSLCKTDEHVRALAFLIVLNQMDGIFACINIPFELKEQIDIINELLLNKCFNRYTYIAPTRWSSSKRKREVQEIFKEVVQPNLT